MTAASEFVEGSLLDALLAAGCMRATVVLSEAGGKPELEFSVTVAPEGVAVLALPAWSEAAEVSLLAEFRLLGPTRATGIPTRKESFGRVHSRGGPALTGLLTRVLVAAVVSVARTTSAVGIISFATRTTWSRSHSVFTPTLR